MKEEKLERLTVDDFIREDSCVEVLPLIEELVLVLRHTNVEPHEGFFKHEPILNKSDEDLRDYRNTVNIYISCTDYIGTIKLLLEKTHECLLCFKDKKPNIFFPYALDALKKQNISEEEFWKILQPSLYRMIVNKVSFINNIILHMEEMDELKYNTYHFVGNVRNWLGKALLFTCNDKVCREFVAKNFSFLMSEVKDKSIH